MGTKLAIVAVAAASAMMLGFDSSKVNLADVQDERGTRRVVEVDAASLAEVSGWSPSLGWPPIPLEEIVSSSKARLREANSKIDDFELRSIHVESRRYSRSTRVVWYFVAEFDPVIDERALFGSRYWTVVLADGTVLLPVTREGPRE